MRKTIKKKLNLRPETLRELHNLDGVNGGEINSAKPSCVNTCYTCDGQTCWHTCGTC